MGPFLLAVAIVGVSVSGPLMAATAAPALAIAFWRNAAATVIVGPVALLRDRDAIMAQTRRRWLLSGLAGLMLAAHFATWVSAVKLTSVAAATALVCMQVLFVVVLDALRGTRASRAVVLGCCVAIGGVVTIAGTDLSVSTRALTGDFLALAGGAFAAVYVVVGSEVRSSLSTAAYTFICYGTCAALLLAACLVAGVPLAGFAAQAWLLIAAVTVCAQLLGHSVINHLLATMSPVVISLALLLEVPGAAIVAAVFLSESLPWATYAGLALILTGLAVVTWAGRRPVPAESWIAD